MGYRLEVHRLVNKERQRRNLPVVHWSNRLAHSAQSQANYCARVGHMVHSNRFAFKGGENLIGGRGEFSPKQVVKGWMHSKADHREYLLSPRVKQAGVGVARKNGKMFVAWAFSDEMKTIKNRHKMKAKSLVRTLLGISGSVLVFFSPWINHAGWVDVFFGELLGVPVFLGGMFGAVVSYWKRRFGAIFMLLAGVFGFVVVSGGGGWAILGCLLLIGCAISAYWDRLD